MFSVDCRTKISLHFLTFAPLLPSSFPHVLPVRLWDRDTCLYRRTLYPKPRLPVGSKKEGRDEERVAAIVAFFSPRPELWSVPGFFEEQYPASATVLRQWRRT